MIKTVIRLRDDAVMVFDEAGEQLPQYEGQYEQARDSILRHAPASAVFHHWFGQSPKPVAMQPKRWQEPIDDREREKERQAHQQAAYYRRGRTNFQRTPQHHKAVERPG